MFFVFFSMKVLIYCYYDFFLFPLVFLLFNCLMEKFPFLGSLKFYFFIVLVCLSIYSNIYLFSLSSPLLMSSIFFVFSVLISNRIFFNTSSNTGRVNCVCVAYYVWIVCNLKKRISFRLIDKSPSLSCSILATFFKARWKSSGDRASAQFLLSKNYRRYILRIHSLFRVFNTYFSFRYWA